ncbi:hypothetical protein A2U01_0095372, partial [Trifolium medium]|nr:hypothetical protein [Trifolium medium]
MTWVHGNRGEGNASDGGRTAVMMQIMGSWATRPKQDVPPFGLLHLVDPLFSG